MSISVRLSTSSSRPQRDDQTEHNGVSKWVPERTLLLSGIDSHDHQAGVDSSFKLFQKRFSVFQVCRVKSLYQPHLTRARASRKHLGACRRATFGYALPF
jgi:hypothetical protein